MANTQVNTVIIKDACCAYLEHRKNRIEKAKAKFVENKFKSIYNRLFLKKTRKEIYDYFNSECGRENYAYFGGFSEIELGGSYYSNIVEEILKLCLVSGDDTINLSSEELDIIYPYMQADESYDNYFS